MLLEGFEPTTWAKPTNNTTNRPSGCFILFCFTANQNPPIPFSYSQFFNNGEAQLAREIKKKENRWKIREERNKAWPVPRTRDDPGKKTRG